MDPFVYLEIIVRVVERVNALRIAIAQIRRARSDAAVYISFHGFAGLFLVVIGSRSIWQLQTELLNFHNERVALSLKDLVLQESEIVAIAVSR